MRTTFIIMLFPVFSLFLHGTVSAQQTLDFAEIVAAVNESAHKHNYGNYFNECSNEAEVIMTGFFVGYKNFFSSQDGRSCTFEPSCSVYAIETTKEKGIFAGFLDTIDRLTRCNGLSPENYELDKAKHLLIDHP